VEEDLKLLDVINYKRKIVNINEWSIILKEVRNVQELQYHDDDEISKI
jgi:hypothetical protein